MGNLRALFSLSVIGYMYPVEAHAHTKKTPFFFVHRSQCPKLHFVGSLVWKCMCLTMVCILLGHARIVLLYYYASFGQEFMLHSKSSLCALC